jgi:hypothetical protein
MEAWHAQLLEPSINARIARRRAAWRQVPEDHREQEIRMITTTEPGRIYQVTGDNPQLVDGDLNAAVDLALEQATKEGLHGILVTRHTPASFTVAVSADVPYGMTRERCEIRTSRP